MILNNNKVKISGENYRHIVKVLRFKKEENIQLFDENSISYQAVIETISSKELVAFIHNSTHINIESELDIHLFQAIPRGNKMDLIVQKSAELGVKKITPVYTERTMVKETGKTNRWTKIALESCKQSGRSKPLTISEPQSFNNVFKLVTDKALNMLFYENNKTTLKSFLDSLNKEFYSVNIIIGPEGGFSEDEIKKAESFKVNIVGLGPRILRTETAAIASVSIVQSYLGDL